MMANRKQSRDKQQVEKIMEEVGQELGVNEQGTPSPQQANQLEERLKREIRKRK